MRIGHQLFEFLQYWTDTGSYCAQDSAFFKDAEERKLCNLRNEVKQVKRLNVKKLKHAVNKYDPESKKLVKQIIKKIKNYESD